MAVIQEEFSDEKNSNSQLKSSEMPRTWCDSDGYETATDTELNDVFSESENHYDNSNIDIVSRCGVREEELLQKSEFRESELNDVVSKSENHSDEYSGIDIVNRHGVKEEELLQKSDSRESELNEKALTEANDAKLEGNSLFKAGLYEEALSKYELATEILPDGPLSIEIRSICYANRAACFSKLGKFDETIKECTKAIELNPTYVKVLLRRGEAHEKLEQYEESIADMTKVVELDESNEQARRTIIRLKPLAQEKCERMKEEMIGELKQLMNNHPFEATRKLKEMGNSLLVRFGMSVDNFKAVKDPKTGSYSLSFQQ